MSEPSTSLVDRLGRLLTGGLGALLLYCLVVDPLGYARAWLSEGGARNAVFSLPVLAALGLLGWAALRPPAWLRALFARLSAVPLGASLGLALLLRLAWVLGGGVEQTHDFLSTHRMALALLEGASWIHDPQGPGWVARPTGPALFVAGHYALLGESPLWAQLTLAGLSTLQLLWVHDLARAICRRPGVGRLAALLLALWPEHLLYTNLLGSDLLFASAVLFALWLLLRTRDRGGWRPWALLALAGAVLGMAQWIRPTAPFFWLGACAHLLVAGSAPRSRRAGRVALFLLGVALPVLPIVSFNARVLGIASLAPAPMSGWGLMLGSNLESRGTFSDADQRLLTAEVARRGGVPAGARPCLVYNAVARELALERLRARPGALALNAIRHKAPILWAMPGWLGWSLQTSRLSGLEPALWLGAIAWHKLLLLCAALALLRRARGGCGWDAGQVYVVGAWLTTAGHLAVEVQGRYAHMFLPFLALAAAGLLARGRARE